MWSESRNGGLKPADYGRTKAGVSEHGGLTPVDDGRARTARVVGGLQSAVRWFAGSAIWICAGAALSACPICFQVEDAGVKAGVRAAVVVLGGITSAVLVGFAVFARRLVRAEQDL